MSTAIEALVDMMADAVTICETLLGATEIPANEVDES